MSITQSEWTTTFKPALTAIKADIEQVIADGDAQFSAPPASVAWSRTGVANNPAFSNSDRTVAATSASGHLLRATASYTGQKRYAEFLIDARGTSGGLAVGVIQDAQSIATPPLSLAAIPAGVWMWRSDAYAGNNGSSFILGSAWSASGDRIGVAWDDTGKVWFRLNGTWVQGDPVAGTSPVFTGLTGALSPCLLFQGNAGNPVASLVEPISTPSGYTAVWA